MGFDPVSLSMLALGSSMGGLGSMLFGGSKKPPAPQQVVLPEPVEPPKQPIQMSQTAAQQKARASMAANRPSSLVLSGRSDDSMGPIGRTSLLGR